MSTETEETTWTDQDVEHDPAHNGDAAPPWGDLIAESEAALRDMIRTHPVGFMIGAAVLGFAVARLVRDE